MAAFFAGVPLHAIESINFIIQNHLENCDCYYIPTNPDAASFVEKIRKTGVFRSVTLLPDIMISYPVTPAKALRIARYRFTVSRLLRGKRYDDIYLCMDGWYSNSIIYNGLKKLNKHARYHMLENGMNAYFRPYSEKPLYLRLFINAMGMTCMDGRYFDSVYMYEPDICVVKTPGEKRRMPKIDVKNKRFMRAIKTLYPEIEGALREFEGKKYLIMEQGPFKAAFDAYPLWNKVVSQLDKSRTLLKAHPRQRGSALARLNLDTCGNHTVPWEVFSMFLDSGDEGPILFSIFSSSGISQKTVMGAEPNAVLLYKLLPVDYHFLGEKVIDFVNRTVSLYERPERVFIPESFEELDRYLGTI